MSRKEIENEKSKSHKKERKNVMMRMRRRRRRRRTDGAANVDDENVGAGVLVLHKLVGVRRGGRQGRRGGVG